MEPAVFISDLDIYSPSCIKIPLNFSFKFQKTLQNLAESTTKPDWDKYKAYSNSSSSKKSWNKLWITTTKMNPVYKSEQLKWEF